MRLPLQPHRSAGQPAGVAFTLLEVMIAMAIFFMAIFAILELVATNLRNARALQTARVDAGLPMADLVQSNKLVEGEDDGDFGDLYPDYRWRSTTTLIDTNGLFEVQFVIIHPDRSEETNLTTQLWRPDSAAVTGAGFGAGFGTPR